MRCFFKDIERVVPIVLPFREGGEDPWLAYSYALQVPNVYVLMPDSKSVIIYRPVGKNEWDGHIVGTFKSVVASVKWMFDNTECEIISGRPEGSVARWSKKLAKYVGAIEENGKFFVRRESCRLL